MTDKNDPPSTGAGAPARASLQVGFWAAVFTALITLVTFGLAITALPNSGYGCFENCVEYPYLDTLAEYPRDYVWMLPALLLLLSYLVLMAAIHAVASPQKVVFSQIGLSIAVVTAGILLAAYYVQFAVVPASLLSGETEGIALLTQYNTHGEFIALEELGYVLMSLSFLFAAPVFTRPALAGSASAGPASAGKGRLEAAVRWIFALSFVLVMASLALVLVNYGMEREYRFEIIAVSIDWLVLIVNGVLLSVWFRRRLKEIAN